MSNVHIRPQKLESEKKMKLDKEEKGILDAYDKGLMNLSTPSRKEKEQIKSMAEKTFRNEQNVHNSEKNIET